MLQSILAHSPPQPLTLPLPVSPRRLDPSARRPEKVSDDTTKKTAMTKTVIIRMRYSQENIPNLYLCLRAASCAIVAIMRFGSIELRRDSELTRHTIERIEDP